MTFTHFLRFGWEQAEVISNDGPEQVQRSLHSGENPAAPSLSWQQSVLKEGSWYCEEGYGGVPQVQQSHKRDPGEVGIRCECCVPTGDVRR